MEYHDVANTTAGTELNSNYNSTMTCSRADASVFSWKLTLQETRTNFHYSMYSVYGRHTSRSFHRSLNVTFVLSLLKERAIKWFIPISEGNSPLQVNCENFMWKIKTTLKMKTYSDFGDM